MKLTALFQKKYIGILLFALVLVGGGGGRAAALPHSGMHGESMQPSGGCQMRCAGMLDTVAAPKPEEQDSDEEAPEPSVGEGYIGRAANLDALLKREHSGDTDARLLRPPDTYALSCSYRL